MTHSLSSPGNIVTGILPGQVAGLQSEENASGVPDFIHMG